MPGRFGAGRRLAGNLFRTLRRAVSAAPLPGPTGNWLLVTIEGDVPEHGQPWLGAARPLRPGFLELLRSLDLAQSDPRIDGVLLRFEAGLESWSQAQSLRRSLARLREAGRSVAVWGESFTAQQYWVASAADRIWLPESGSLFLVGLRSEQIFLRDALAKLGVTPEVVHIGRYKSAGDFVTRDSMSNEQREQIEAWQSELFEDLVEGIASGRALDAGAVRNLIDEGPYAARAAVEARLIDDCCYPDEFERRLEPLARVPGPGLAGPRRVHLVDVHRYYTRVVCDVAARPLLRELPALAWVVAAGSIQRGARPGGISSEGFGRLLEQLRGDKAVRGVALRLDSPGGDALASDLLHRAVELLRREKPVVVSMADVAASGGYYIAAAADAVFAEAGTVTGSIGVVGGKLNLAGLYKKLGVAKDFVQHGARAGVLSEAQGFSPDERAAVRREMEAVYGTFLDRVARGRRLERSAVEEAAQGRIWSGRRALALGLVDGLGGPLEALRDLGARAGLREGEPYRLLSLPRVSALPVLRALLGLDLSARSDRLGRW